MSAVPLPPSVRASAKRTLRRAVRFAAGLARAGLVLFGLGGVVAALCLRSAEARAREALLDGGRELRALLRADRAGETRALAVNGLRLKLTALSSTESVRAVLDRLQAHCEARSGLVFDALNGRVAAPAFQVRAEVAEEGSLACLDTGKPLRLAELSERLRRISTSGDISELARPFWAVANRVAGRTAVLLVWAEGSLELAKAFPRSGDAPGFDPRGLERPEGARRLLSAAEAGTPYSFTLYELRAASVLAVRARYVEALEAGGFTVTTSGEQSLAARRGGDMLVMSFGQEANHGVRVGIAELREAPDTGRSAEDSGRVLPQPRRP